MMGKGVYSSILHFHEESFVGVVGETYIECTWGFIYYSFVTLTTLGYGDITPVNPFARSLAYLEAVCRQFYIAILVASLVSAHISKSKMADN